MSKLSNPIEAFVFCGVDVSAAMLAVAIQQDDQPLARIIHEHEDAEALFCYKRVV
jgi:hypothetical protein